MRIGALALLLMFIAGAGFGFFALSAMMPTSAPVDTYGNTVSNSTNTTQSVVLSNGSIVADLAIMLAVIVAVLLVFVAVIYLMTPPKPGRGR